MNFAEMRYSAGSREVFKSHMHRTLSIGAIDRGIVRYRVADKEADLQPGSLAIINPEVLHACNPLGDGDRSYYMLYLETNWCSMVQQTIWNTTSFIEPSEIRIDDQDLYNRYCSVMNQLMDEGIYIQKKEEMLFELVREVFLQSCSLREERLTLPENIEKLKALLAADLETDLPLADLADELGANPYTLIRQFKKTTGHTPHAYRMNCRIDLAKNLLRKGRDIAEVALECGFFDQSHLHRHFKAMTTVTPQDYRVNFIQ